MKKSLIITVMFIVLTLISLPFALMKVNAEKNNIAITEEVFRGDPAAVKGIVLQVRSHWNRQLFWETEYIVGDEKGVQSKFAFSEKKVSWGRNEMITASISFRTGNKFFADTNVSNLSSEEIVFSKIIQKAAEKIDYGKVSYNETVQIKDFYDYYPIILQITGHSTHYLGDYNEKCRYLTKYFHIPVGDDALNLTVKKNTKNDTLSFEGEIIWKKEQIAITDVCAIGKNGIYYTYCLTDIAAMESVDRGQNTGIFYFPFEEEQSFWKIDLEKVEKLCEFPYDVTPLKILVDQEQKALFLLARKGGEYRFFVYQQIGEKLVLEQELPICQKGEFFSKDTALNLPEEEIMSKVFLENTVASLPEEERLSKAFSGDTAASLSKNKSFSKGEAEDLNEKEKDIMLPQCCQMILKGSDILITWNNGWFSFLTKEESGYRLWCESQFPDIGAGKDNGGMPFSWEHACIFDGERLVLAAFEHWYSLNIVLAAYQKEEEVYVGLYRHSAESSAVVNDIKGRIQPQGARIWKPHSEWYWDKAGEIVEPLEIIAEPLQ